MGLIPGLGVKIPLASRPKNSNTEQKPYGHKFNQGFKNGPHKKYILEIIKEIQMGIKYYGVAHSY